MTKESEKNPLEEWNRLERENTENAIVSSMFDAGLKTSFAINDFSTWLLIGTATIGAFMISNADGLIPIICKEGFLVCGLLLCLSSMFGLVSKIFALLCKVGLDVKEAISSTFRSHLDNYAIIEEEIQDTAKITGINIKTGIRFDRIMAEFLVPMPWWVKWLVMRQRKKNGSNPQQVYVLLVKRYNRQAMFAFFQALCFLAFMVVGVLYASQI